VAMTTASVALAAMIGTAVVCGIWSLLGIALAWRCRHSRVEQDAGTSSRVTLLAIWLAGMFVATPLYYPYPRLTMLWLFAAWLGTALGAAELFRLLAAASTGTPHTDSRTQRPIAARTWSVAAVIATVVATGAVSVRYDRLARVT